jgi:ATP-dependent helicase/DNAse subunit B
MKMQATMSFNYPDDEDKLRRAINAEQMYESLTWILDRIDEYYEYDDNPDSVVNSIKDKVKHTLKLIGES